MKEVDIFPGMKWRLHMTQRFRIWLLPQEHKSADGKRCICLHITGLRQLRSGSHSILKVPEMMRTLILLGAGHWWVNVAQVLDFSQSLEAEGGYAKLNHSLFRRYTVSPCPVAASNPPRPSTQPGPCRLVTPAILQGGRFLGLCSWCTSLTPEQV